MTINMKQPTHLKAQNRLKSQRGWDDQRQKSSHRESPTPHNPSCSPRPTFQDRKQPLGSTWQIWRLLNSKVKVYGITKPSEFPFSSNSLQTRIPKGHPRHNYLEQTTSVLPSPPPVLFPILSALSTNNPLPQPNSTRSLQPPSEKLGEG